LRPGNEGALLEQIASGDDIMGLIADMEKGSIAIGRAQTPPSAANH
jgi:hypothetical protein